MTDRREGTEGERILNLFRVSIFEFRILVRSCWLQLKHMCKFNQENIMRGDVKKVPHATSEIEITVV